MFLSDNLERVDRAQCICMFLSDNLERDENALNVFVCF